jgi:hypothetical protein
MYGMPAHHAKLQDGKNAVFLHIQSGGGEESHDCGHGTPVF